MRTSRRTGTLALAVAIIVVLGASTVAALTSRDSREFVAGSSGVAGKSEPADFAGLVLATGNFDGDRFADVIVGTPLEDRGPGRDAGQIQVFYGSKRGLKASRDRIFHPGSPGVAGDAQAGAQFGAAVVVADFDNDGYDDAAVGAPGQTVDGNADAGVVIVLRGSTSGLTGAGSTLVSQASVTAATSPGARHRFGHSLAAADFNADGFVDLAIGAPGANASSGGLGILDGSETGFPAELDQWITQDSEGVNEQSEADDLFAWSLATGDFDGDAAADLAVGVPGEGHNEREGAGVVHVFAGSTEGLTLADTPISENTPGVSSRSKAHDGLGSSLATGDFDGDDFDDLAIGIPAKARKNRPATGAVQVLPGSAEGLTGVGSIKLSQNTSALAETTEAGDDFGWALTVGDFDATGRDDLAVGVPGERVDDVSGAGLVHVFLGRGVGVSTRRAETWRPGANGVPGQPQVNGGVGRALAAGDFDDDGRDDLVVGVPGRKVGAKAAAGSFFVLYG